MQKPDSTSRGLREHVLSGNETLAQSVALIAPSAGPLLAIPVVFGSAGNGTWLAFTIAMATIFAVALSVNHFARRSFCPGSLYSYISSEMHPFAGLVAAWSLLLAYVGTAVSIGAGFVNYSDAFFANLLGRSASPFAFAAVCLILTTWLAYRDVTISARVMLGFEVASVALILIVVSGVIARHGFHVDREQLTLQNTTPSHLCMGLVLAIFALVGFESATSLGTEAKDPLVNIPRAVKWSGILAGLFFVFCAYGEVVGFRGLTATLDKSAAPLSTLASTLGLPTLFGTLIDLGGMVSFFSCVLACITAAGRIVFFMGQRGALPRSFGEAHNTNQTPHRAVLAIGLIALLVLLLSLGFGISAGDIYGLAATLATFGFLTCYILISIAAPRLLMREKRLTKGDILISTVAVLAMSIAFVGNLYPVPSGLYRYVPYLYLILAIGGITVSQIFKGKIPASPQNAIPAATMLE